MSFPTFGRRWRSPLQWPLYKGAACAAIAAAVKKVSRLGSFDAVASPSFFSSSGLPPHVLSDLRDRFPRISNLNALTTIRDPKTRAIMWRRVTKVGNDRQLSQAREQGFLNNLSRTGAFTPVARESPCVRRMPGERAAPQPHSFVFPVEADRSELHQTEQHSALVFWEPETSSGTS